MGWVEEAETTWSTKGMKKSIPELQKRLIEIINATKGYTPPDKPPTKVPQRKSTQVLGTQSNRVKELEAKKEATTDEFELSARKTWKERNERGEGSVHQSCHNSFLKQRIEVLVSFDIDQEDGSVEKVLHWCGGVVKKISDGTWLLPNARTRCYPENGAAEIEWDPIPFINMPACKGIQVLSESKWNKDCEGAWRDFGDENFGLK